MSGGSYDYLCYKMEDAARTLVAGNQPIYRQAFGRLMMKCAKAMHEVEWVDSSDKSPGDDENSIMECITTHDVLNVTIENAKEIADELKKLIKAATKKTKNGKE